jgi:hypothetical protein
MYYSVVRFLNSPSQNQNYALRVSSLTGRVPNSSARMCAVSESWYVMAGPALMVEVAYPDPEVWPSRTEQCLIVYCL